MFYKSVSPPPLQSEDMYSINIRNEERILIKEMFYNSVSPPPLQSEDIQYCI